jgi:hypothetical protein
MKKIRSYQISTPDRLKVTDWTTGPEGTNISERYGEAERTLRVARVTASIDVYADTNGEIEIKSRYESDNFDSVLDYQVLFQIFATELPELARIAKT